MSRLTVLLFAGAFALPGCLGGGCGIPGGIPGADPERVPENDDSPLGQLRRMGQAAEGMAEAAEEMSRGSEGGGTAAQPIDFRTLQGLLPDDASGLPRTGMEGERSGAMGMTISQATGTYEGEADGDGAAPRLTIKISDLGGIGAAAMFGAAWTMASIDRESDREYERTVEIGGQPAYIKYDRENRSGNFQAFVASRFLVVADGRNMTDEQIQAALTSVSFRQLEGMRNEGR